MRRMNLYEQQASNRRTTWLIMIAFVAFLLVLGLGFDAFYLGAAAGGGYVPIGTLAALGVGSVSAFASYYSGDRAVLAATSAAPIEEVAAAAGDDRQAQTAPARERRRRDGHCRRTAAAARLHRSRCRSERVCDRPRPGARVDRRDARAARYARSRGTAGRRRARDESHQESRYPGDDDRGGARRRRRAAGRLGAARA